MNNPVKCFKCHFIGKFRYFSRFRLNSAWIQHEFNMNSTPMWCKMLRKALWNFKVKMKSAWIQHEFDMNSTPASPQPNLHQNLGKNLQFNTKSQNHWKCMKSAWIWHESDMNGNIMLHVWICMNSAWIRHENGMNLIRRFFFWKKVRNNRTRFVWVVVWIGGLELEESKFLKNPFMLDSCWIHAFPGNRLESIFLTPNPNRQSKTPQKIWKILAISVFIWAAAWCWIHVEFMLDSCWIHAGFMLNSCIFRRVTLYFHSCQIHVRFMLNSCIFNDSEIWCWIGGFFPGFWCKFGWGEAGVEFMSNSCWIHADFILTLKFHNALRNICITLVLNSCWIHAEFKRNREKYLNLPIKWHLKHLTGLFMLYTIRNTVWDFSKNC